MPRPKKAQAPTQELTLIDPLAANNNAGDGISDDPCSELQTLQRFRRYYIRAQSRSDRAVEALIANQMLYSTDLPKDDRLAIFRAAAKLRKTIEDSLRTNEPHGVEGPQGVFDTIRINYIVRAQYDQQRADYERRMKELARELPVWPWVKEQRGIAELGLAVIIAETGDLSNYSGPNKVWKRLGLACIDGHKQGSVPREVTGEARSEAWKKAGYNPQRRAEIWAFLDDVMCRSQWRAAKMDDDGNEIEPAHALGPYGQVYADRKQWNLDRGWVKAHADRDARRIMAKRFIRDLWVAWQDATSPKLLEAAE